MFPEELWIINKPTKWDRGRGGEEAAFCTSFSPPPPELGCVSDAPGTQAPEEKGNQEVGSPVSAPSPASFQVSRCKGHVEEREGLSESPAAQLMASSCLSQGCSPKAAVGAQRLILEAVKIKETEHQEGSWGSQDGEELRGGGAVEESSSCATNFFFSVLKAIAFRSQRAVLLDLTLFVCVSVAFLPVKNQDV